MIDILPKLYFEGKGVKLNCEYMSL